MLTCVCVCSRECGQVQLGKILDYAVMAECSEEQAQ